jgi:hypothetical protein
MLPTNRADVAPATGLPTLRRSGIPQYRLAGIGRTLDGLDGDTRGVDAASPLRLLGEQGFDHRAQRTGVRLNGLDRRTFEEGRLDGRDRRLRR